MNKGYYPFLDGYRALAILWVIVHHAFYFFQLYGILNSHFFLLKRIAFLGFLGVDTFFVISGFLITGILIEDFTRPIRLKRFYFRRAFKIIPQYLFAIVGGIGLSFIMFGDRIFNHNSFISYFLFLQNYVVPIPLLGHLWSIAIEEHFYLCYALLVTVLFGLVPQDFKRYRILLGILLILLVFGNLVRFFWFRYPNSAIYGHGLIQYTHVRFDALIFGCVLRLLERLFISQSINGKRLLPLLSCFAGGLIYVSFIFRFNTLSWSDYTLAYFAIGLLIVSSLNGYRFLNRVVENPYLIWIGKKSYGIYLWHYIILLSIAKLVPNSNLILGIFIYFLLSVTVGALATNTLEKAFLNVRRIMVP